jgi:hypothetical protein
MMSRIASPPPRTFIKPPVKIAQAPPPPEELEQPSDLQGTTAEILTPPTSSEGSIPPSSQIPSTTIEENTDRTLSDGNGNPILEESSSRNTIINRQQPTVDFTLRRSRTINNVSGEKTKIIEVGVKGSMTGSRGSASIDLSDKTTVIGKVEVDDLPKNTAIGFIQGDTCKITKKGKNGAITRFEAPKVTNGTCIEGSLTLTDNNHIVDEATETAVFTQPREGLPAGVTIEYKQIPKKK